MYSPKISEKLIPIIYTKAKQYKVPMTKYVNDLPGETLTEKGEFKQDRTKNKKY
jgi:hypothetical protein